MIKAFENCPHTKADLEEVFRVHTELEDWFVGGHYLNWDSDFYGLDPDEVMEILQSQHVVGYPDSGCLVGCAALTAGVSPAVVELIQAGDGVDYYKALAEMFSIPEIIWSVADRIFESIAAKHGEFLYEEDPEAPYTVETFPMRFAEAIQTGQSFRGVHRDFVKKMDPDKSQLPNCLLYTSPSPRDRTRSRMPSSA